MTARAAKEPPITKVIVHPGTKNIQFKNGTKSYFHFQTSLCDDDKTVIDDSRKMGAGKPMELILGKKFKLEVWEAIIQMMALNEVSQFTVNKDLVMQYPFVSRTLRDISSGRQARTHSCAMTVQTEGVGYDDLNRLIKNPQDLQFTFELIKVEQPEEYEKETWQMDEDERLKEVPILKEKGNDEFRNKNFLRAADHYYKATGIVEQLLLQEKPHTEEWNKLNKLKVPLLLNYSQCKLIEGDYYAVIEHCTTVLQIEPENIKALYRRAKANIGAWNPSEAKKDFIRVMELDQTLSGAVKKELELLDEQIKEKDQKDKETFKKLF